MDTFLTLGILQSVVLIVLLWKKRKINSKVKSNLIGLLLLSALVLLGRVTFQPNLLIKLGPFVALTDVLLFMFGPLTYFLTRSILKEEQLSGKQIFIHFIPAIFHAVVLNTFIGLIQLKRIPGWGWDEIMIFYKIIEFGGILSCSIYIVKSFFVYRTKKVSFFQNYASPQFPNFLKNFIIVISMLIFIWLIGFTVHFFKIAFIQNPWMIYSIFWYSIVGAIYLLTYYILAVPEILNIPVLKKIEILKVELDKVENKFLDGLKEELENYMYSNKPYLDSSICLDFLADETGIKRHDLSYIINNGFGMNFFDYINHFRTNEFIKIFTQRRIIDNAVTFIEIAFETGFNSKSAFYRAFKKEKNCTPSQYFENEHEMNDALIHNL